nr:ribonuclease H-like domain-containing protein [Tanacetum cinerariifolium]
GSESRPPILNKENYVPWSSRLLRYAKSRPNEKLIHNSILNGPYVRRMIAEPGDGERDVNTILLGLPEDIYALGDLKGKCKDTSCVSDTQNQLSQKLENANVELEFQVLSYARENAHLKATYKNLFDSIFVSRV